MGQRFILRISPRLHQAVEVALVCRKGLRQLLLEDYKLKTELKEKLKSAGVSAVEIERPGNKLRIIIRRRARNHHRAQGRGNRQAEQDLQKKTTREVHVDIQEVHKPELDAQLVSESIALQLEKRVGFRRPCASRSIRRSASVAKASKSA